MKRLLVTLGVQKLLKAMLRVKEMELQEKLLTLSELCLTFNGSFGIHELLSREGKRFDPIITLQEEDLEFLDGDEARSG